MIGQGVVGEGAPGVVGWGSEDTGGRGLFGVVGVRGG